MSKALKTPETAELAPRSHKTDFYTILAVNLMREEIEAAPKKVYKIINPDGSTDENDYASRWDAIDELQADAAVIEGVDKQINEEGLRNTESNRRAISEEVIESLGYKLEIR